MFPHLIAVICIMFSDRPSAGMKTEEGEEYGEWAVPCPVGEEYSYEVFTDHGEHRCPDCDALEKGDTFSRSLPSPFPEPGKRAGAPFAPIADFYWAKAESHRLLVSLACKYFSRCYKEPYSGNRQLRAGSVRRPS